MLTELPQCTNEINKGVNLYILRSFILVLFTQVAGTSLIIMGKAFTGHP